jgi:hypothetical protein
MNRPLRSVWFVALATGAVPVVIELFELYWLSPLVDNVGHFLGGISVGGFVYLAAVRLADGVRTRYALVLLGVAAAAGGWEVIEANLPWVTRFGFRDTASDIVMSCLGGPAFLLWLRLHVDPGTVESPDGAATSDD